MITKMTIEEEEADLIRRQLKYPYFTGLPKGTMKFKTKQEVVRYCRELARHIRHYESNGKIIRVTGFEHYPEFIEYEFDEDDESSCNRTMTVNPSV